MPGCLKLINRHSGDQVEWLVCGDFSMRKYLHFVCINSSDDRFSAKGQSSSKEDLKIFIWTKNQQKCSFISARASKKPHKKWLKQKIKALKD